MNPRCIIIAGCNGSGKTTFAKEFLPKDTQVIHFVNADLIAAGLSPLKPEASTLQAGRLFLSELDKLALEQRSFSFESTLSGLGYLNRLKKWKKGGYHIEIVFLKLKSTSLALKRVASRVKQGGHHVPAKDIFRRYERGWINFQKYYQPLADNWTVYDNSDIQPQLLTKKL